MILYFLMFASLSWVFWPNKLDIIPGPWIARLVPCLVTPFAFIGKVGWFGRYMKRMYPNTKLIRIGRNKIAVVDHELALQVLETPQYILPKMSPPNASSLHPMIRDGLPFISDIARATELRTVMLTSVLGTSTLNRFHKLGWETCIQPWLDNLSENPEHHIHELTQQIILSIILDEEKIPEKLPTFENGVAAQGRMVSAAWQSLPWIQFFLQLGNWVPGYKPDEAPIDQFMESLIDRPTPPQMVQIMQKRGFSRDVIQHHLTTVFQAADDTTSFALRTMIYLLAMAPDSQEALFQQLAFFEEWPPHYEDLKRFTSLELWIHRSLCFCTPIPILRSRVVADEAGYDIDGLHVPRGTVIGVASDAIMDSLVMEYWNNIEKLKSLTLSFGRGGRMCPGHVLARLQMTYIMAGLIKKYSWEYAGPVPDWDHIPSLITRYYENPPKLIWRERKVEN